MTSLSVNHQHLRQRRLATGLSTRNVADHLGVSTQWLKQIERGGNHPNVTLSQLNRLANLLDIEPLALLTTAAPADHVHVVDQRPLPAGSLRLLDLALRGTLTPAPGASPVVHLKRLRDAQLLDVTAPRNGPITYRVADTVTFALDRQPADQHHMHRPPRTPATWRDELLNAVNRLEQAGTTTFTATMIANEAINAGTKYKSKTLRLHVQQHLASPILDPTRQLYMDLERITYGTYRRAHPARSVSSKHGDAQRPPKPFPRSGAVEINMGLSWVEHGMYHGSHE